MTRLKKAVFTFALVTLLAATVCQTAFATCYVSCAAICRYTCQVDVSGSCSDAQAFELVRSCCTSAFSNTPGINDVPCMQSGPES
jgi:hypothetical protein